MLLVALTMPITKIRIIRIEAMRLKLILGLFWNSEDLVFAWLTFGSLERCCALLLIFFILKFIIVGVVLIVVTDYDNCIDFSDFVSLNIDSYFLPF